MFAYPTTPAPVPDPGCDRHPAPAPHWLTSGPGSRTGPGSPWSPSPPLLGWTIGTAVLLPLAAQPDSLGTPSRSPSPPHRRSTRARRRPVLGHRLRHRCTAPRWRRLLYGTPHLAYEYRWAGRALTIVIWVPGTVAVRAVAAAARAAWPARTVTVEDRPPPPIALRRQRRRRAGRLLPVHAGGVPAAHRPRRRPAAPDHRRRHRAAPPRTRLLSRSWPDPRHPRRIRRLRARTRRSCATRTRTAASTRPPRCGGCSTWPTPARPQAAPRPRRRHRVMTRPANATSAPSSTRPPTDRTGRPRSATA